MTHPANDTAHKAICALCRNRTPEQVAALRRQVAQDLAHGAAPPMTADQVIAVLEARPARASRRRPPRAHTYLDPIDGQAIGIVRYDGDPETWERLARRVLDEAGVDQEAYADVADPVLGWWRMNVCPPNHWLGWAWSIARVDGPGPGRWKGAEVRFKTKNEQGAGHQ